MAKADRTLRNGTKAPASAYLTADERAAKGRALRDTVPPSSQSGRTPAPEHRDPVTLLEQSNAGRMMELVPIRFGRMLASPFAFYRGAAAIMAAELRARPRVMPVCRPVAMRTS
ncbi:hypothetical protein CBA19C6_11120 [Cupriavidus pauculus]|nr:hypothetical protein CBA19C6_11120 [Cupriavidus pauculus]